MICATFCIVDERKLEKIVLIVCVSACLHRNETSALTYRQIHVYVSLQLRVQNAVSAQPCVGKLGISLVLLRFLGCNFRLWFETP